MLMLEVFVINFKRIEVLHSLGLLLWLVDLRMQTFEMGRSS